MTPFPSEGWRSDGSRSYGSADLYRDIPHVVVNVFPESARAAATEAHRFLKEKGASTATIVEIVHVDGQRYVYVFAERSEFLAVRDRWFPEVAIAPLRDRNEGAVPSLRVRLAGIFQYTSIAIAAHGLLFALYALALAPLPDEGNYPFAKIGFYCLYLPASILAIPLNPVLWRFGLMEAPGWFAWPTPLGFAVVYAVWVVGIMALSLLAARGRRKGTAA